MTRRRISLALAVLGVVLLTVGTGGFSSVDADRNVRIAVANDGNALLGVNAESPELDNGKNDDVVLFTAENQASSSSLSVTVLDVDEERESGKPAKVSDVSARPGSTPTERRIVADQVVCAANPGSETRVTVRFRASTDGFSIELERDVPVSCTGQPPGRGPGTDSTTRTATETGNR